MKLPVGEIILGESGSQQSRYITDGLEGATTVSKVRFSNAGSPISVDEAICSDASSFQIGFVLIVSIFSVFIFASPCFLL